MKLAYDIEPDGSDQTAQIQEVLNGAGIIHFAPGTYKLSHVKVRSNTRLVLHPSTVLLRVPGNHDYKQMLALLGVRNVTIEGGCIDGNRAGVIQPREPEERVQCISLFGGSDITIRDVELRNSPQDGYVEPHGSDGDGLYVGAGPGGAPVERLRVSNLYSHNHERHGIFCVSVRDSVFENCVLSGMTGQEPGSALNLEPNYSTEVIQNVTFRDCVFENSQTGVTFNNHYSGRWEQIRFIGCVARNNRVQGFAHGGADLPGGVTLTDCSATDNGSHGFSVGGGNGIALLSCRSDRNGGIGFDMYNCQDFSVSGCFARANAGHGFAAAGNRNSPMAGVFIGCSSLYNGGDGFVVYADDVGPSGDCDVQIALNRIRGNVNGVYLYGRGARGARLTRNVYFGNSGLDVKEQQQGDANTYGATDLLESVGRRAATGPLPLKALETKP